MQLLTNLFLPPRKDALCRRRGRPVRAEEAGRFRNELAVLLGVDGPVPRGVEHGEDEV